MNLRGAFRRWRGQRADARGARKIDEILTPDAIRHILWTMGGRIERGQRRESELPFSRPLLEAAYIRALQETPEGPEFRTLCATYSFLDDYLLSDADAEIYERFRHFRDTTNYDDDASTLLEAAMETAAKYTALRAELSKKAEERVRTLDQIRAHRSLTSA